MEKGKENGECEERSTFELSPLFLFEMHLLLWSLSGRNVFLNQKKVKLPLLPNAIHQQDEDPATLCPTYLTPRCLSFMDKRPLTFIAHSALPYLALGMALRLIGYTRLPYHTDTCREQIMLYGVKRINGFFFLICLM